MLFLVRSDLYLSSYSKNLENRAECEETGFATPFGAIRPLLTEKTQKFTSALEIAFSLVLSGF